MTGEREFDICGPLPTGVTVLEASAGTGKTYTIAALATRYVAAGVRLEHLLLVTFTRMATGELRDRVRQRLTTARAALDAALAAVDPLDGDDALADHVGAERLLRLLATGSRDDVKRRRDLLARAIADFDAATITTTHAFCREVMRGLGVAGDVDPGHRFSDDARELVDEVVDDLYVKDFLQATPAFGRSSARKVVELATRNPTAPLAPPFDDSGIVGADGGAALRHGLAVAARCELDRRQRHFALMTHNDFVVRLRATLEGEGGPAVAARLRAQYRVALVDEFQDTDPDQWAILRTVFNGHDDTALILIGDPKQAVYAFRGADVYAYLDAKRSAGTRETLTINRRSDQGLLTAYDALFGDARLGHEDIVYRQVSAAPANAGSRLRDAAAGAPLRVRVVGRETPGVKATPTDWSQVGSAREHIARDVAADVAVLLRSGAAVEQRDEHGAVTGRTPLGAGDVAVLVRTNRQAEMVKDALDAAGVPAVINGAGSVFDTRAARDWLRLLEALERPESLPRARAAALTAFVAWSAEEVASAPDERWDGLQHQLYGWAGVLRAAGVAALMETITQEQQLPQRLLETVGGERELTDLRHLAELLHAAVIAAQLGITALAGWLRRRMAGDDRDAVSDERLRRLESDAAAVQVLTTHRSKGLEFGVVYCPFLWDVPWVGDEATPVMYHDAADGDQRTIDVSMDARDTAYTAHVTQALAEGRGEELRLAYVALTRAKHRAVIWWATTKDCRRSALGRLLLAQDVDPGSRQTAEEARHRFLALREAVPGCVVLEPSALRPPDGAAPGSGTAGTALRAAVFDRVLDARWRRMSYTSITRDAYEARVDSEVEEAVGSDDPVAEDPLPVVPVVADPALAAVPSLLSETPVGTRLGTFVHGVLEAADFAAADITNELAVHVGDARKRRTIDVGDPVVLVDGLRAAIETPLGPLAGDARLRDVAQRDRLDEMAFELPLAGGDAPSGELTLGAIASVLRAQLGDSDPLAGYADRLADPALKANLRGYLTGTIDLVARVGGGFAIMDYKTNRLAAAGEALTAWHHRPEALAEEMQRSHYALQALLYAVALHRYLRWRLPGYAPDRDRPAIFYLFLRGMVGEATPRVDGTPCGVFAWRPPAGLLPALSDVLDGAAG